MTTKYTDLQDGGRFDMDVEFICRRPVDLESGQCYRLLVADQAGTEFDIFTTPKHGRPIDLKTGATHHVRGCIGVNPSAPAIDPSETCPQCGDPLRPGRVLDAVDEVTRAAVGQLDLDRPFGLLDETGYIGRFEPSQVPPDDEGQVTSTPRPPRPSESTDPLVPDFVCSGCGSHLYSL